jgi:hypothetical protein
MDKAAIIRKLTNPFSYSTVEIPREVKIDHQSIDLKQKVLDLARVSEEEVPKKVLPEVVQLDDKLSKMFDEFKRNVENSEIDPSQAESQLDYYLGIKRAIVILRGISEGTLKQFSKENEQKQRTEDKKRWYKTAKKLAED